MKSVRHGQFREKEKTRTTDVFFSFRKKISTENNKIASRKH